MRPEGCEAELLRLLTSMPFLERMEMVCVTGRSRGAVYEAVEKLESGGFCASVLHSTQLLAPARRFHLTEAGLRRLADEEGITLDGLLRARPVSAQWRRSLMDRLDALASIYRVACAVADVAYPIRFRWYRSNPLDAAMTLPDGRSVGVVRQGITADRTGFTRRLRRLANGPVPGTLLILTPDEVRLRHARRMLSNSDLPALLAVEREAVRAGADERIWTPSEVSADIDLRYELERAAIEGGLPDEPEPERADPPADIPGRGAASDMADHLLPVMLSSAEKRALDVISDWPWASLAELAGLMDITPQRASQVVIPIEGLRLVTRPTDADGRLALNDRGLAMLARRDRTSVAVARKRLSVAAEDPTAPLAWRNVSGGRSRQLLRNIEHTAAVHGFLAALAAQARLLGWEVAQLDPPRRASRHFRHDGRLRAVYPDAFGVLKKDGTTWPFFLEWERRAVRPSTMSERLAPYLRYYSSHRPTDDHGTRPAVLVVFDDDTAATGFLRVAREETRAADGTLPLWVSHRRAVDALGPLGHAWRSPGDWTSPQAPLPQ